MADEKEIADKLTNSVKLGLGGGGGTPAAAPNTTNSSGVRDKPTQITVIKPQFPKDENGNPAKAPLQGVDVTFRDKNGDGEIKAKIDVDVTRNEKEQITGISYRITEVHFVENGSTGKYIKVNTEMNPVVIEKAGVLGGEFGQIVLEYPVDTYLSDENFKKLQQAREDAIKQHLGKKTSMNLPYTEADPAKRVAPKAVAAVASTTPDSPQVG